MTIMVALIGWVTTAAAAEVFTIDSAHSAATFAIRHMVISTVRGSLPDVGGTVVLDRENPERSSVKAQLNAAGIDTGDSKRDGHLRSRDFLDVKRFPAITFESAAVTRTGNRWVAHGRLTLHGVTREVDLPFTVAGPVKDPWGNTRLGVETEPITLDRKDFDITWNKTMDNGGLLVGDSVKIVISLEAVAQAEPREKSSG